jgi:hypothetical protein
MEEGKERVKEEEIKVVRVSLSFSQNPSVRFPSSSHSSYLCLPHFQALPSPHDHFLFRDSDGKGKRKSKRKKREKRRKKEERIRKKEQIEKKKETQQHTPSGANLLKEKWV